STYAWLAANSTVTATGMEVSAKTDIMFLQIRGTGGTATTGTIEGDGNDFDTSGAVVMTNVKVYPSSHLGELATPTNIKQADTDPNLAKFWYYAYSDLQDDGTINSDTKRSVSLSNFNKYVVEATYQVRVRDGTNITEVYDLYVKSITIPAGSGIKAIVVGQDRLQEFTSTVADNAATAVSLSDTVTTTPQTVTVYLYIDGNSTDVYTDNISALLGDVTMELSSFESDTL
ncbi:MAG: hypothetical protein IKN53_01090, partial [Oscillibacter sp.]|nr:hypothetical protein [Oscillibacter sp.]